MKKVLVLEDELSIRSFIVINLKRAGYEVVEAERGEQALELLEKNPDAVCWLYGADTPINLPVMQSEEPPDTFAELSSIMQSSIVPAVAYTPP